MKLFQLYNVHTRKFGDATFESKYAAKQARDELNGGVCDARPVKDGKHWNKDKGWRVTLGVDHWRYKSS